MAITFKPIRKNDIDAAVAMMQDFYAIDGYPINPAVSKMLFEEFIENEGLGKGWLIYSDNTIVGYVILTFRNSRLYNTDICF